MLVFDKECCIKSMQKNPMIPNDEITDSLDWINAYDGMEVVNRKALFVDNFVIANEPSFEVSRRWCKEV